MTRGAGQDWDPEAVRLPDEASLTDLAQRHFEFWGVAKRLEAVRVRYNRRMRSVLGRARLDHLEIQLNPRALERAPEMVEELVGHEAAHLAAWVLHGAGIAPHGEEWRRLMREAGIPITVRHRVPVDDLRQQRSWLLHICAGCGARLIRKSSRSLGPCACGTDDWDVFRSPRTPEGLQVLKAWRAES